MKFSVVGEYFEQIEQTSKRLKMTELLAELLHKATPQEANIITTLSLGKLHPPYVGTHFNLAEKTIITVIAKLLREPTEDVKKQMKTIGDVGLLVNQGNWRFGEEDPTVIQVYKTLCAIEQTTGVGSQEAKTDALYRLLHSLDYTSAKYVARVVLGKLRLGFSDMTLVDALSWMEVGDKSIRGKIEDAYNVCADIGFITQTLKEGGLPAIEDMHIQVGIPIRPASAERLPTARAIIDKIGHCVAQPKLDGFRLQVHVNKTGHKPVVHFFSRNLQDMSAMFPDLYHAVTSLPVKELICEGEAIVYNSNTGGFLPFQETVKRKRKHNIEKVAQELPLQVFLFDVLYVDGVNYLPKTHAERRKKLVSLGKKIKEETVFIIDEKEIATAKQLEDYFTQNIASGLEGLVVKREDAVYIPGKRNFNWIKIKRQEEGHLDDTLDCVILGYYAGKGKRAGFGIGAFLVGVYNKKEDTLQTIAKIGTGLKDLDWHVLKEKCDAIAVHNKPRNVVCSKDLYPDVWVHPELVCYIRADEITMSPIHTAGKTVDELGFALRFPRFMGYRSDKSVDDATTVSEVKQLFKHQFSSRAS